VNTSDSYLENARKWLSPAERKAKVKNRAISRFLAGAQFGELLMVTLTTPPQFQGDIHQAWRKFLWRCRRRGLYRRYFAVREFNALGTCEHLHVVFQTQTELEASALRAQWLAAVNAEGGLSLDSIWTHHSWVRTKGGCSWYVGKYMTKASESMRSAGKRAYWYSSWWVFPGYVRFAKGIWSTGAGNADRLLWQVRKLGESEAIEQLCRAVWASWTGGVLAFSESAVVKALFSRYPLLGKGVAL